MTPTQPTEKQQPAATVRLGSIVAAIWPNETKDGRVLFNTTVERIYMDQDDNWQSAGSFGRDDLLTLAKVCDMAHTRVHELQAELRKERGEAKPESGAPSKPARKAATRTR